MTVARRPAAAADTDDQELLGAARHMMDERKSSGGLSTLDLPDGVDIIKLVAGSMDLDIVPYTVTVDNNPKGIPAGKRWYQREYWVHFNIGVEGKAAVCLRSFNAACPICEEHKRLLKDEDPKSKELAEELRPKKREMFNTIDLASKEQPVGILDHSFFLFGAKLENEVKQGDPANATFMLLRGGKTLRVRFVKKSLGGNSFLEADRFDFLERQDYDVGILSETVDLDNVLKQLSYQELETEMFGADAAPAPVAAAPTRRAAAPVAAPAPRRAAPEPAGEPCTACGGTGQSSRGRSCGPCKGTGIIDPQDSLPMDDAPAPAEAAPARRAAPAPAPVGRRAAAAPAPESEAAPKWPPEPAPAEAAPARRARR